MASEARRWRSDATRLLRSVGLTVCGGDQFALIARGVCGGDQCVVIGAGIVYRGGDAPPCGARRCCIPSCACCCCALNTEQCCCAACPPHSALFWTSPTPGCPPSTRTLAIVLRRCRGSRARRPSREPPRHSGFDFRRRRPLPSPPCPPLPRRRRSPPRLPRRFFGSSRISIPLRPSASSSEVPCSLSDREEKEYRQRC